MVSLIPHFCLAPLSVHRSVRSSVPLFGSVCSSGWLSDKLQRSCTISFFGFWFLVLFRRVWSGRFSALSASPCRCLTCLLHQWVPTSTSVGFPRLLSVFCLPCLSASTSVSGSHVHEYIKLPCRFPGHHRYRSVCTRHRSILVNVFVRSGFNGEKKHKENERPLASCVCWAQYTVGPFRVGRRSE